MIKSVLSNSQSDFCAAHACSSSWLISGLMVRTVMGNEIEGLQWSVCLNGHGCRAFLKFTGMMGQIA
jgi:hypothetical protein